MAFLPDTSERCSFTFARAPSLSDRYHYNFCIAAAPLQTSSRQRTQHEIARFPMRNFPRIKRLPAYVFNITNELKMAARRAGEDIIDMSMWATCSSNADRPARELGVIYGSRFGN